MIPTRLIKRGVIRLVFIIPVLWFALFLISFYVDDISNSYVDEPRAKDKRDAIVDKKNINVHNLIKEDSKMHNVPVNVQTTTRLKSKQKNIDHLKQMWTTKGQLVSTTNTTRYDDNTETDHTRNKDRQVLAAPNHPKMRLIDPNGPGWFDSMYCWCDVCCLCP